MALGAFMDSFLVMEISRFIFGMGGESLAVAQSTYAAAWFRGNALNTVFGLQLSISRGIVLFQTYLSTLFLAFTTSWSPSCKNKTQVSLLSGIYYGLPTCCPSVQCHSRLARWRRQQSSWLDNGYTWIFNYPLTCWRNSDWTAGQKKGCLNWIQPWRTAKCQSQVKEKLPDISALFAILRRWLIFRDVLLFPLSVWLVCFVCVTFYVTIFPFVFFAKDLYMQE